MSENEAIARAVQHYIDGAKSGSSAEMRRAFHDDATIFGYEGESVFAGPIQRLYDWNDQNGPAEDLKANIVNIDVAGRLNSWRVAHELRLGQSPRRMRRSRRLPISPRTTRKLDLSSDAGRTGFL
jgi:hypothetical protein